MPAQPSPPAAGAGDASPDRPPPVRQATPRREAVAIAAAVAVGAGLLLAALTFPVWSSGRPGPGLFPLVVAGTILLSGVLALPAVLGHQSRPPVAPVAEDDDAEAERDFGPAFWKVPALCGCLVGYVVVVEVLGHLLSSALLTWLALLVVGGRSWWQQLGVAVVFSAASYAVFGLLLGVPLPDGGF